MEEEKYIQMNTTTTKQTNKKTTLRSSINANAVQEEINGIEQRSHMSTPLRNHCQDNLCFTGIQALVVR